MENLQDKKVDLKQFKGHHRRFPWAMLVRVFIAFATIAMIWYFMEWTKEIQYPRAIRQDDHEIEIEYQP